RAGAVGVGFLGDEGERLGADAKARHVALDLQAEELRRQHQPAFAVPGGQAERLRIGVEGATRMLVEAERDAEVELAGLYRPVSAEQGRAAGGAAVGDVDR